LPAAPYAEVSDDFARVRLEVELEAGTVTDDELDVIVADDGFVPDAVAVLVTDPASTSACVAV
jgi:hypothetical protein